MKDKNLFSRSRKLYNLLRVTVCLDILSYLNSFLLFSCFSEPLPKLLVSERSFQKKRLRELKEVKLLPKRQRVCFNIFSMKELLD